MRLPIHANLDQYSPQGVKRNREVSLWGVKEKKKTLSVSSSSPKKIAARVGLGAGWVG
jgi:hypothetical protein